MSKLSKRKVNQMRHLTRREIRLNRLENNNKNAPVLVCDDLKFEANIGSFIRLADAFGSKEVIFLHNDNINAFQKKSRYASAVGCERNVNHSFIKRSDFLTNRDKSIPIISVDLTTNSNKLENFRLPEQCYFVFGNESTGISEELLSVSSSSIHIEMNGLCSSLNVSHTASIVMYEWRRQFFWL